MGDSGNGDMSRSNDGALEVLRAPRGEVAWGGASTEEAAAGQVLTWATPTNGSRDIRTPTGSGCRGHHEFVDPPHRQGDVAWVSSWA